MKILLLCFGGWSSSILAKKIEDCLKGRNIEAKVSTAPLEVGMSQMKDCAAVMIAPQVRHMSSAMHDLSKKTGTPVLDISMQEYQGLNIDKLVDRLLESIKAV